MRKLNAALVDVFMSAKACVIKDNDLHRRVEELELAIQLANERIRSLEIELEYTLLETRQNGM